MSLIVYNFGNNFSVSSLKIKRYIQQNCLFKKFKKIQILENFIDTERFYNSNKKKFKNKIIMINRISKEKNIEFIIEGIKGTSIEVDIIGEEKKKVIFQN